VLLTNARARLTCVFASRRSRWARALKTGAKGRSCHEPTGVCIFERPRTARVRPRERRASGWAARARRTLIEQAGEHHSPPLASPIDSRQRIARRTRASRPRPKTEASWIPADVFTNPAQPLVNGG